MIRRKIQVPKVLNRGLLPLTVATLLICALILMWLMSTNGRLLGCTSEVWKTPALYLEHIGDEDKPIYPLVIAASRPNERELGCAVDRLWMSPEVFLVKDEELAEASKLSKGSNPGREETAEPREFRYVLVSKPGIVESGFLDGTQSHEFFTAMATYFDGRQPELHEHLTSRRF
jgi:hypothetical protein